MIDFTNPHSPHFDPPNFGIGGVPLPPPYFPPEAVPVNRVPAPPRATAPELLPRGAELRAGRGRSVVLPDMDFETYSEAGFLWDALAKKWTCLPGAPQGKKGLSVVGLAAYAEHPSTVPLMFSYDLKDGVGKRTWLPGMSAPLDLFQYLDGGGLVEAWNVGFEFAIWNKVCVRLYGWPVLRQESTRCAMAKSRAYCLPGSLDNAGAVTGVAIQKDKEGSRLIKKFCIPRNPTAKDKRTRMTIYEEPVDGQSFIEYNRTDIVAEAHVSAVVPDLEGEELEFWKLDQRINQRGVRMDVPGIGNCCAIVEQALEKYNRELYALTGGQVARASELEKCQAWLRERGLFMDSLDADHIEEAIKLDNRRRKGITHAGYIRGETPMRDDCRRLLEIRGLVGSAAVKKVFRMRNSVTLAGRLHDLFIYYGARTGRTTGDGPQPTNLPNSGPAVYLCGCGKHYGTHTKACPWCGFPAPPSRKPIPDWTLEAAVDALAVIATRSLEVVEHYFGDAMAAVSGCLRALFIASEGCDLICSDYSAIEAVVLAMIAGEQWRIDVFRTHGKIYEASAAAITGTPFAEFMRHAGYTDAEMAFPDWYTRKPAAKGSHHPLRKTIGKVAELASGYQGWVGSWIAFGADEFMDEEAMKKAILAWRAASPNIVEFWGGQMRNWQPELYGVEGMFISAVMSPGREFQYKGFKFLYDQAADCLYLTLLSGRNLHYHRPRLRASERRRGELSISYEGNNTNPKNGPVGWIRMDTWGGRLTENIVQATARDIQWYGMLNLDRAGYPIVLHVYDENVGEVPKGWGSVAEFERIMATMPPWATGWPIKAAGGWLQDRYSK